MMRIISVFLLSFLLITATLSLVPSKSDMRLNETISVTVGIHDVVNPDTVVVTLDHPGFIQIGFTSLGETRTWHLQAVMPGRHTLTARSGGFVIRSVVRVTPAYRIFMPVIQKGVHP